MIWLAFLDIVIMIVNVSGFKMYVVLGHTILGLVILGLAYYNSVQIKETRAPNRLKRITKSTVTLAAFELILGIILFPYAVFNIGIPFVGIIDFLHLAIALAIITQASSVATAYDMWEEKEYTSS
jgi:hypothetical protein